MGALCCCLRSKDAADSGSTEKKQESDTRLSSAHTLFPHTHRPFQLTSAYPTPPSLPHVSPLSNTLALSSVKGAGVVLKAGNVVSGTGTVLGNSQLLQNRSYWEVHVVALPPASSFCVGVTASPKEDLTQPLSARPSSYALSSTHPSFLSLHEGDVLGLFYDLSGVKTILGFSVNGRREESMTLSGIKGDVYPAISVDGGAAVKAVFEQSAFKYGDQLQGTGFEAPIRVRSVM